jgi:hypothetical protein
MRQEHITSLAQQNDFENNMLQTKEVEQSRGQEKSQEKG